MRNDNTTGRFLDTYLGLCTEVYDLSKPHPPEDAYTFYREYAAAAKGPILEPMCGTGRFLIPFLEEGFDIQGFDASDAMLAKLRQKGEAKGLTPHAWHGFAQDLVRSERYDLIFIPTGSFCLITNLHEAKTVLEKFCEHLNDDGILLFEAETMKAVPTTGIWRGSFWPNATNQKIVLSQLATLQDSICISLCKYELLEEGKIIHTEIEELKVRIYAHNQLLDMLKAAGFNHIRILKAFDRNGQPQEEDETIVYECRK